MRIAFIGQKGLPAIYGGVEKHVEGLATRLALRGHEVFVYVRNHYTPKDQREFKGVKLVHVPTIPTKHLDAITHTLFSSLHALFQDYDVIHYHAIGPTSLSFIPRLILIKTKVAATFHCQDYFHQKWGWFARLCLKFGEYVTCHAPHQTVVVSKTLREYAKRAYGRKTTYIPNGASVRQPDGAEFLKIWKLEPKRYIVAVTRLIKHKGIHYLIKAFNRLSDAGRLPKDFKLAIVGDGFHTDDYVRYLSKISEGRNNVVFTGTQNGETLTQLFAHAYLFVQPSQSEGLSIALIEAMQYGVAPLVSNIPENLEAIGPYGFSFETRNIDDLGKNIAHLIEHPEEVAAMAERSKKRAKTEYDWNMITEQTELLYQELISRKE